MTLLDKMKVAQVQHRGPAQFEIADVPIPSPGPGQVLIRVESAGVNFSDVKRRRGDIYPFDTEFPYVPGGEIAGAIVGHGAGVDSPPIGTKVLALAGANGYGGYAQFAVSYAQTAVPIPDGLSTEAASTLLVAGSTAKLMLRDTARLQQGESILIPAATGGVGSFAVQIAKRAGARQIIAVVGRESKRMQAIELGANDVVVSASHDWPDRVLELTDGRGVDVALDSYGGDSLEKTFRCLASFGRLVVFGAASGTSAQLSAKALERFLYAPAPNQTLIGFNVGSWFMERPAAAAAALIELITDILNGHIQAPSIRLLPLAEAAVAHQLLESRETSGKLVIKPWA